ncbi:MAG TPA: hypothetical protein VK038_08140 [Ornithinicoccus sp.]|nr:hypothetical protein [Ornithinicoccus sp.]
MTPPAPAPHHGGDGRAGMLLLRGAVPDVTTWARKGVVPVTVAALEGWTVVLADGPSRAQPPYDDALTMLAARRVPARLRPALGFFVIDGRAVITAQSGPRHRRGPRWVVWDPDHGVLRPPGLPVAPPAQLVQAAGGGDRTELVEILRERHLDPARLLAAVTVTLGLPGGRLLVRPEEAAELEGAVAGEPDPVQVRYFDDAVRDAVQLRRELELEA